MHFPYNSPDFFHFPRSNFIPKNQNKITINTSPATTCQQLMIKQPQRRTITHTPSTLQQISNNHPLRTPDKETRTFKVCVFSDHLAFNFSDCSDVKVTGNGNSKDCERCSKAKCKVPWKDGNSGVKLLITHDGSIVAWYIYLYTWILEFHGCR